MVGAIKDTLMSVAVAVAVVVAMTMILTVAVTMTPVFVAIVAVALVAVALVTIMAVAIQRDVVPVRVMCMPVLLPFLHDHVRSESHLHVVLRDIFERLCDLE